MYIDKTATMKQESSEQGKWQPEGSINPITESESIGAVKQGKLAVMSQHQGNSKGPHKHRSVSFLFST